VSDSSALYVDSCQMCGRQSYITEASFTKHTGMLIIAQTQRFKGFMCEECIEKLFRQCEIHCALAGWWGIISLFIYNPIALVGNVIMYFRAKQQY
jgi:hypothetical protein